MAKQHWLVPSPSELPHLHTRRLCPCQHWGHVLDQSLLFISLLNYLGVEKQYLPPKQDVTFAPVPFINFLIPFTSFLACDIFYFSRPTLNPGSSSLLVDQPAGYLWKQESTVVGLGWGPITCISFFFFLEYGWFTMQCFFLVYSKMIQVYTSSVQFSRSVVSDSLWLHELQQARPPCPSPTPGVYSNSCPLSQWCHPAKPSHPLSSPSPPAPNPSQHQGLFQWGSSSHQVAKGLEFQLQHQSFQWTPRTDL